MIEITVRVYNGPEIAQIRLERVDLTPDELMGTYSVQFAVNIGESVALYQRRVDNFPRTKYNVLGLLQLALDTLSEQELYLDADPRLARHSPDLARRLERALREI